VNPFVFHAPTRITFGEGVAAGACEIVKGSGGNNIFLVIDRHLAKTQIVSSMLDEWRADKDLSITVFADVMPDTNITAVNQAIEQARAANCNAVIALGGGSVIDTAKVVNIALKLGGNILDYQGMNNLSSPLLPSVAIPTTAGTGAEVSLVAMMKDENEGKKLLFGSPFLAMEQALLDPTLIMTLPPRLTAATGMDAATHAIEAFVAECTNSPLTDILSLESLRMLFTYLPQATKEGSNIEARSQTLVASTMAGLSFSSAGVGIVHALSHAIGGQYATHHGMTNAVMLPHGMKFNLSFAVPKYAQMARYLKLSASSNDKSAASALIEAVEMLVGSLGLPTKLRDLPMPEPDSERLGTLITLAMSDPAMIFNSRQATEEDIIEIYRQAY
jgi:alcohol dehydrogenase